MSMRRNTLALLFNVVLTVSCFSTEPEPRVRYFSAKWLEESLIASIQGFSGNPVTKDQAKKALELHLYYSGFLEGINYSSLIVDVDDALLFPDPMFLNFGELAPSILSFMREKKEFIDDSTESRDILFAWYLTKHPKSDFLKKSLGNHHLQLKFARKREAATTSSDASLPLPERASPSPQK